MEMAACAGAVLQAAQAMAAVSKARASLQKDFIYWLSANFLKILLQIFILPIADCRLPIADCRLPIADYTSG
jgi:hypothetical protein